jgi:hypothetical protein
MAAGPYAQLSAFEGGVSRQVAAQDVDSLVAVHFGGGSFWASAASDSCAQQIGVEPEQSDAVEQVSVAFAGQEAGAAHEFVCAGRFAQHT